LETSLALGVTHLVKPGHLTLAELVRKMSTEPARLLKLPGGALNEGAAADITVFDPNAEWIVEPTKFKSKGQNTPFGGQTLTGQATLTLVGGKVIYENA
jgi:dihydroorotase